MYNSPFSMPSYPFDRATSVKQCSLVIPEGLKQSPSTVGRHFGVGAWESLVIPEPSGKRVISTFLGYPVTLTFQELPSVTFLEKPIVAILGPSLALAAVSAAGMHNITQSMQFAVTAVIRIGIWRKFILASPGFDENRDSGASAPWKRYWKTCPGKLLPSGATEERFLAL
ncbi:hypothetical protein FS827_27230 [Agrobacterium vitis]|nr:MULTISPECIES: hypothetical protein [Rhizobium/Agrobacterium group]MCF1464954.1 hypothetical protein [Allorhizobium ampelinum]MVA52780.1 hypothetical protein [Agrobacterium vitis]